MWHVVTMDYYIAGPFKKKRDAMSAYGIDDTFNRKRYSPGCYEYWRDDPEEIQKTNYNIVNDKELPNWSAACEEYTNRA